MNFNEFFIDILGQSEQPKDSLIDLNDQGASGGQLDDLNSKFSGLSKKISLILVEY